MLDSLFGFILIVTPLVLFHELGHYALARYAGVHVEVFSVGFGRELLGYTDRSGTRWRLSLIPLGGYVKMHGELVQEFESPKNSETGHFMKASLWQRMSIVAAGPVANIILAIAILFMVNMTFGVFAPPNYHESGLGNIAFDSPAEQIGMQPGDVITRLNNAEIKDFSDILHFMQGVDGTPVLIEYHRGDTSYQDRITPRLQSAQEGARYILGVTAPNPIKKELGALEALRTATQQSIWLGSQILYGIGGIISGVVDYSDLGGPIKIAQYSGETLMAGTEQFLLFAGMLSVNLALINLFPIPGLDGGHLLLLIVEGIIRRPPPAQVIQIANKVGILFVLALIVIVSVKDIYELFL